MVWNFLRGLLSGNSDAVSVDTTSRADRAPAGLTHGSADLPAPGYYPMPARTDKAAAAIHLTLQSTGHVAPTLLMAELILNSRDAHSAAPAEISTPVSLQALNHATSGATTTNTETPNPTAASAPVPPRR